MKTFADYGKIRDEGNLPEKLKDGKLAPHLIKASIELKKILTADKYKELVEDNDSDDFETLSIAEANLALSYAVTSLNIETHGTGIVRSKGYDESRSDLLSQREVSELRDYYRKTAMDLIVPFITQPESTDEEPADEVIGSDYRMSAL